MTMIAMQERTLRVTGIYNLVSSLAFSGDEERDENLENSFWDYPFEPSVFGQSQASSKSKEKIHKKYFTIIAPRVSATRKYIQRAILNGPDGIQDLQELRFTHRDVLEGSTLVLIMGEYPEKHNFANWS